MNLASHFNGVSGAISLALIAFSVVFMVLTGLSCLIFAIKYLGMAIESTGKGGNSGKPPVRKAAPAPAPKQAPAPRQAPLQAAPVSGAAGRDELVAVITAAVAATVGHAVRVTGIRQEAAAPVSAVRRFGRPGWKSMGRMEQLEGFIDL